MAPGARPAAPGYDSKAPGAKIVQPNCNDGHNKIEQLSLQVEAGLDLSLSKLTKRAGPQREKALVPSARLTAQGGPFRGMYENSSSKTKVGGPRGGTPRRSISISHFFYCTYNSLQVSARMDYFWTNKIKAENIFDLRRISEVVRIVSAKSKRSVPVNCRYAMVSIKWGVLR